MFHCEQILLVEVVNICRQAQAIQPTVKENTYVHIQPTIKENTYVHIQPNVKEKTYVHIQPTVKENTYSTNRKRKHMYIFNQP